MPFDAAVLVSKKTPSVAHKSCLYGTGNITDHIFQSTLLRKHSNFDILVIEYPFMGSWKCRALILIYFRWLAPNKRQTIIHRNGYSSVMAYIPHKLRSVNILKPRQNGRHLADNIFKYIHFNENFWIIHKISPKYVPYGFNNKMTALVQIMAWCRTGDEPLSEPMLVCFTDSNAWRHIIYAAQHSLVSLMIFEIHLKLKSYKISFAHNFLFSCQTVSKICREYNIITTVICVKNFKKIRQLR